MTEKKLDWDRRLECLKDGEVLGAKLVSSDYKGCDGVVYRLVQVEKARHPRPPYSAVYAYHEDGAPRYVGEAPPLRNKVKKVTKWYNLYADRPGFVYFDNEESARGSEWKGSPPRATLPIEIEEPE